MNAANQVYVFPDTMEVIHNDLFSRHVNLEESTIQLVHQLLAEVCHPDLKLPILPKTAQEALHLSNDPNVTLIQLRKAIEADALIAARMMAMANSALYCSIGQTSSLQAALARLGMDNIRRTLMTAVLESHILGGSASRRLDILRQHSILVAYVSQKLCEEIKLDSEYAFLCGLFHDIGQPILLSLLPKVAGDQSTSAEQHELVDVLHGVAGQRLLSTWNLPELAGIVARRHHSYGSPKKPEGYSQMANVIAVADRVAYCVGVGEWPLDNELAAVRALEDLNFEVERCADLMDWASELKSKLPA